jgi:hypothetical protein
MSWASERLEYLHTDHSYSQISAITSIPASTISYVINNQRQLPNQYRSSLRNSYQREVYSDLRTVGLSATQSQRFSWYSPTKVIDVIQDVNSLVDSLIQGRMDQYKNYLMSTGQYTDDTQVVNILESSIRESLRNSDLPEERYKAMEYRNTSEL